MFLSGVFPANFLVKVILMSAICEFEYGKKTIGTPVSQERARGRSTCEPIATLSLVLLRPSHRANVVEVGTEQTEWCLGPNCVRDEANT